MRTLGGIPIRAADKVSSGTGTARPGQQQPRLIRARPHHRQVSLAAGRRSRRSALRTGWRPRLPGAECTALWTGGQPAFGQSPYGPDYGSSAYANYQELQKKKSPIGWWIAGAALVIVIIVVAVLAIRAVTGGDTGTSGGPVTQPSQDACPPQITVPEAPVSHPADGRVHGGPVSYPHARRTMGRAARPRAACRLGGTC